MAHARPPTQPVVPYMFVPVMVPIPVPLIPFVVRMTGSLTRNKDKAVRRVQRWEAALQAEFQDPFMRLFAFGSGSVVLIGVGNVGTVSQMMCMVQKKARIGSLDLPVQYVQQLPPVTRWDDPLALGKAADCVLDDYLLPLDDVKALYLTATQFPATPSLPALPAGASDDSKSPADAKDPETACIASELRKVGAEARKDHEGLVNGSQAWHDASQKSLDRFFAKCEELGLFTDVPEDETSEHFCW